MEHNANVTHIACTYDDRGWLSRVRRYRSDGTLVECVTLTFDDAGRPVLPAADGDENTTAASDETGGSETG
jgi:hypothetical protein